MLRTELIQPLPTLLRTHASRFPDKIAFQDAGRSVTYAELERRTARIAGHLADLRLGRGDRAAIYLGNRVEMVESYLAIARASAIGSPFNPRATDAELAYLLDDSGARVVITDAAHVPQLSRVLSGGADVRVVVVGRGVPHDAPAGTVSFEELATTEPAVGPRDDLGLDDLAWMLYTSGTTGRPKGVLSTQRNCLWSVAACYAPVPGLSAEDRVLWPLPLFHSLSHIACVLGVTAVGASARIVDGFEAEEILQALREDSTTFLAGVPTMYHYLVRAARQQQFTAPDLRMCLVGGAITTAELRRSFEEVFGAPLLDAYGSTETCGSITINWPTGARVEGSCGLPVPGLGVRLVDPETGLDVPAGAEGEVWVSGPSVMAGYHNQPEATAKAIQDGWYRTGDLAKRDAAGYFTVTGRIKELIIRGGENIHPVEVEEVLRQVPGVADAAVVGKPHETLGEVPVACVVPGPEGFDPQALLAACREQLSYFKVPEELYEIAEVPRTASGKITRHVLLEQPARLRASGTSHYESLFRLDWLPLPSVPPVSPAEGRWALLGDGASRLFASGEAEADLDLVAYAEPSALYDAVTAGEPAPDVTVLAVEASAAEASAAEASAAEDDWRALAEQIRQWLRDERFADGKLLLTTTGAVSVAPDEDVADLWRSALWGHVRGLQAEHPGRIVLADLDTSDNTTDPAVAVALALSHNEPQFAVRSGVTLLPRLARVATPAAGTDDGGLDTRGTVLVTGADGVAAAEAARQLVHSHGVRHVLLLSAGGEADRAAADLKAELVLAGARVALEACDPADRAALTDVLARHRKPLTAVLHTWGSQDPTAEGFLRSVTSGALNLHELTAGADLAAFVLFSSAAGLLGAEPDTGHAPAGDSAQYPEYGAAAAFLNALAQHRRAHGRPALALAWGPGDGLGADTVMAPHGGIGRLSAQECRAMLDAARSVDHPVLAPLRTVPEALRTDEVPALLREVIEMTTRPAPQDAAGSAARRQELIDLPEAERDRTLLDLVRTHAADVLDLPGGQAIGVDRAFKELGCTSVAAVQLRGRLADATGLRLAATVAFDHPTPSALARHLREMLLDDETAAPAPAPVLSTAGDDPVAIVAMGCRLPGGVDSPEALWQLVEQGLDAISEFPTDRGWDLDSLYDPDPDRQGTSYVHQGGFLHDAGDFDAAFFGISPREALAMDPQQRLLLETSWEVFERAGIAPSSLRGQQVGVFSGLMNHDYGAGVVNTPDGIEGYRGIGTAGSVVSGRVAYTLGLEGPAITVDTACSSSLVALHLAAQALRAGECAMALAGGVAIMAQPTSFIEFSRQRGLAPDSRCKAFAEGADGTAWSEGVGVLLLERLSDARRNGHQVLAVLKGSAVNQDGASNGLTAPSGPAQQRVIRQALAHAQLTADQVDAVEAHGTGTALGDPIEAQALLATYGQGRPAEQPLWLGSLKSNIGHAQAAAGVAGVIKMVLAMRNGVLPQTLHVDAPSSYIDWSAGAVELLTEARGWPETGRPRRAAVSSFGVSGTNAHVILEHVPDQPQDGEGGAARDASALRGPHPLLVSARGQEALRAQADRLRNHLNAHPEQELADVAHALATTRALLEQRAAVVADNRDEARLALDALAEGRPAPGLVTGTAELDGKVVFVLPGQGSQWAGMGAELLDASEVFAQSMAECSEALAPHVDWSLLDVIRQVPGAPTLERCDVVQPASFAVMVSLAKLWRSQGVEPDAVVGHSQGEIAAACVAGALSLADAARVVALRSRAIAQHLAGHGGMLSVALPADETARRLAASAHHERIERAAVNGPSAVVLAGAPDALDAFAAELAAQDVRVRRIPVDYASHSAYVEQIETELSQVLEPITPRSSTIPFYSTVDDGWLDTRELNGRYWYRNLRQTVRFEEATRALLAQGFEFFVEVSSHPVLTPAVQETAEHTGARALATGTLRRDEGGLGRFLTSLAGTWVRGLPVTWQLSVGVTGQSRLELPTYAFQRRRYWLESTPADSEGVSVDPAEAAFWAAVENADATALAAALDTGGQDEHTLSTVTAALPALSDWRRRRRELSTADEWRYRVTWQRLPADLRSGAPSGRWLTVLPSDGDGSVLGEELRRELLDGLRSAGAEVVPVDVDSLRMDAGELTALIGDHLSRDEGLTGVLSLLPFDERPVPEAPGHTAGLAGTTALVRALAALKTSDTSGVSTHPRGLSGTLWSLTRGAVTTGSGGPEVSPAQAMVWGLGRVAALEHPEVWGGLVDLPQTLDERALRRLAEVLGDSGGEDQLALRATGVFARRLAPAPLGDASPARPWQPRGTVLVTGGTGGVGAEVARRLAASGAEHLVLTSRRGPAAPGAEELAHELRAAGARVTLAACEATDRAALADLLATGPDEPPLTAVVHAAGVGQDCPLDATDTAEFSRVLGGKVAGAAVLDELLGDTALDAFVLMSSAAGVWGGGRQGAYAAANAYLDALAERRRAEGRTATAVAWGSWGASLGLGAVDGSAERLRRLGLLDMTPATALAALTRAVEHDDTSVAIAHIDWARFHAAFTMNRPSPLLADLPQVRAAQTAVGGGEEQPADGEAARLATLPGPERDRALLGLVRAEAAAVLGHSGADALDAGRAFRDQGFDSMTAVELRDRLAATLGLTLPSTVVFDHPTPGALTEQVGRLLFGTEDDTPSHTSARTSRAADTEDDPIVIVGMSARLPGGVNSPEDLWKLVDAGGDAVAEFPSDRGWNVEELYDPDPGAVGKSYVKHGSFLYDAGDFDAAFFGISPREALAMDPQQRVLLETAWEVLERAGIDPTSLQGSRTGVFVGAMHQDYGSGQSPERRGVEGYFVTGNAASVLSGRVAYTLGLEGPAVTVDTACSSSLVSLHMACQALRSGECDLAMAGGVTVMARPDGFVEFSRQQGLSTDGRCRAFAASADGTGWSEGAGLLLVERLSDARRNGHPVLAVVRGTAINQDGASNGLTAPNGTSQQRVIRQALADAGLDSSDVDVVEAHGTGTKLGDPIEAHAVLATYGQGRPAEQPLWLGSLKSNIGHTQAAAGVAGVIKMVMAIRNGVLPRTLHIDEPSPHVDWSAGAVELLTESREWSDGERARRAGVSSFGISGTNAHVILEQAPPQQSQAGTDPVLPPVLPWLLSGHTDEALRAQAERLVDHLDHGETPEALDVAYSLSTRATLDHRAVVVGDSQDTLLAGLRALAGGEQAAALNQGTAVSGRCAVLFTGQGAQRLDMGRELDAAYPVFAEAFDEICAELDPHLPRPLREVVFGDDAAALEQTAMTQAALFALEVALFRLTQSFGVRPDMVAGHSVGELAAAHVAGVLSLADACALVAARGSLMQALPSGGAMVAVEMPEEEVLPLLAGREQQVSIAAVNGPSSVVLSGDEEEVLKLAESLAAGGGVTKRLRVSHAFHSPLMEPMLADFHEIVAGLSFQPPAIPLVSTRTGTAIDGATLSSPDYWTGQVREAVRFADAVHTLHDQGVRTFLELGPGGVLTAMVQDCLAEEGEAVAAVPTLRRDHSEPQTLLTALARLHVRGVTVDWSALFNGGRPQYVDLPTYAFQRRRYWLESAPEVGDVGATGLTDATHPLLRGLVTLPDSDGLLATGRLSLATHVWLADHEVAGSVLVPGTALVEAVVRVGDELGYPQLDELIIAAPLVLPPHGAVQLQIAVAAPDSTGRRPATVHSRPADAGPDAPWTRHADGLLAQETAPAPSPTSSVWPPEGATAVDVSDFYPSMHEAGYVYGPTFRGLRNLWTRGEEVHAEVALPDEHLEAAAQFGLHPGLLDSALHAAGYGTLSGIGHDRLLLPFAWNGLTLHADGASALRVSLAPTGQDAFSLTATDPAGNAVLSLSSLAFRQVSADQLRSSRSAHELLHQLHWTEPASTPSPADPIPHQLLDLTDSSEAPQGPRRVREVVGQALAALQSHLADGAGEQGDVPPLVILTRGGCLAEAHDRPDTAPDPAAAGVWGLVRTAQSEHPDRFVLIDVDEHEESRTAIPGALASGEPQLALRAGRILLPRLATLPADTADTADTARPLDPQGTVLITGGTGMLGSLVARHLAARHGVRHLLLLSRSGDSSETGRALRAELTATGTQVTLAACDVGDREALAATLAGIPEAHPLTAVIHTAGVLDDGVIEGQTPERLDTVFRPKVDAAWHLHELTQDLDLASFVLFSSASGLLGTPGQGNYASANAFLDALAQHRRAAGLPGTSLAWGLWAQASGMTDQLDSGDLKRGTRGGMDALGSEEGMELLDTALRLQHAQLMPARLNLAAFGDTTASAVPPLLRGMVRTPRRSARGTAAGAGGQTFAERLAGLDEAEQSAALLDLVRTEAATALGHDSAAAIDAHQAFSEVGFDSLTAVELRNRLTGATGVRLPATLVFDYPTPTGLAEHLADRLGIAQDAQPALLAELDRLEEAFSATGVQEELHAHIAARLEALAAKVWAVGGDASEKDEDFDFDSATDEEIFGLIDNELGS